MLRRPKYGIIVVFAGRNILKGIHGALGCRGTSGTPQEGDGLCSGASVIRAECGFTGTERYALLGCPLNRFVEIVVCKDVHKSRLGLGGIRIDDPRVQNLDNGFRFIDLCVSVPFNGLDADVRIDTAALAVERQIGDCIPCCDALRACIVKDDDTVFGVISAGRICNFGAFADEFELRRIVADGDQTVGHVDRLCQTDADDLGLGRRLLCAGDISDLSVGADGVGGASRRIHGGSVCSLLIPDRHFVIQDRRQSAVVGKGFDGKHTGHGQFGFIRRCVNGSHFRDCVSFGIQAGQARYAFQHTEAFRAGLYIVHIHIVEGNTSVRLI